MLQPSMKILDGLMIAVSTIILAVGCVLFSENIKDSTQNLRKSGQGFFKHGKGAEIASEIKKVAQIQESQDYKDTAKDDSPNF